MSVSQSSFVTEVATTCAVLVVDATGRVVAANESARLVWAAADRSLVNVPLADLFVIERAPPNHESKDETWLRLKAATLKQWTWLAINPRLGAEAKVRVRLERAFGGGGTYVATILVG